MTKLLDLSQSNSHDLSAAVAEAFFHYQFQKPAHGACCTCQYCGRPYDECSGCRYAEDWDNAAEVIGVLLGRGYTIQIHKIGQTYDVEFATNGREYLGYSEQSLPIAICRAALATAKGTS